MSSPHRVVPTLESPHGLAALWIALAVATLGAGSLQAQTVLEPVEVVEEQDQDALPPRLMLVAPDGTAPDGTAPDGTAPDGTAPDGTAPDGAASDVTEPSVEIQGWLEIAASGAPTRLATATLGDVDGAVEIETIGPTRVCTGAIGFGARCLRVDPSVDGVDGLIPIELLEGSPVVGRYVLGLDPVVGAEVTVVPRLPLGGVERITGPMPLALDGRSEDAEGGERLVRAAATDEDGAFGLPPLAPGVYQLETLLPTGRVHRSEPFEVPPAADLAVGEGRTVAGLGDDDQPVEARVAFDLGTLDVTAGLDLTVTALDPAGEPLAGVEVSARQGESAASLVTWRATSDETGQVALSGFDAEQEVLVGCAAQGWVAWSETFEIPPTDVDCVLDPLGRITGVVETVLDEVLDVALAQTQAETEIETESEPPLDGRVSLHAMSTEPGSQGEVAAAPTVVVGLGDDGGFAIEGSVAGSWRLVIAAPGFAAETIDVDLEVGERRDLGVVTLRAGRAVSLRVVDVETGAAVPEAVVEAVVPEGAGRGVADADGELDLVLGADPVTVAARAEGYAPTRMELSPGEVSIADDPLLVRLRPGGWIRALVWDGDGGDRAVPCGGCVVRVPSAASQGRSPELRTDAAGEALSEALAPGRYRVVRPGLDQLGSTVVERPEAEVRWVTVVAGEIATVLFGDREEAVRVVMDPVPAGRWAVTARTPSSRQRLEPDADGAVLVRRHRGETLHLYLHLWDAEAGAEIEIRQGPLPAPAPDPLARDAARGTADPTRLETVRLAPGTGIVHGRAVRHAAAGGEGVGGRPLTLREVGGGWLAASARTRPDGAFQVPYLPTGVYQLFLGDHAVQTLSVGRGERLDVGPIEDVGAVEPGDLVELPTLEDLPDLR